MGKKKIIVSERDNIAALFEDDQAIEFIIHRGDMLLGDVYLATVENILPSIDAAFVNVGGDKMGFLHSSDVQGKGDLKNRLQPKQQLIVQVMKEPTGHKGPRVTTNISLPGRFLVLMPESKGISISRKIEQQSERSRLKSVVSLIKPPGVGVIIRTEADQQKESDIQEDFETLLERWQNIVSSADTATPPTLLYRDQDLLYRVIREAVTDDVKELHVDTAFGQQRAQQLLQNWNLDKNIKVQLYSGNQSILIGMGVDREIKQALQTKVPLPLGGYLYIQPTEALCVIDVNSGKFTSLQSQAETIRLTNLEAAKEIARQLRLRNIGGMIIVDFIDMESRADQLAVLEAFENELAPDKAKPQIGQLSDLGLVEMTRHRQGQALSEIFTKRCIACSGTGFALEEFNWAPPTLDGDARGGTHRSMPRNKLPIRQGRPAAHQASRLPAASPANAQSGLSLKKLIEPGKPASPREAAAATGGPLLMNKTASTKEQAPDEKNLDEYYKEKTYQKTGLRFANVVKLSHVPPVANSVLARINPKSNDILTLVDTIEGSLSVPAMMGTDEDEGDEAFGESPAGTEGDSNGGGREFRMGPPPRMEPGVRQRQLPLEPEPELSHPASRSVEALTTAIGDVDVITEDLDEVSSEEEEVPFESDEHKPVRRGRPPKRIEEESEEVPAANQLEEEEPAPANPREDKKPKRRRGRPPKRAVAAVEPAAGDEAETEDDSNEDEDMLSPRRGRRTTIPSAPEP